MKNKVWYFLILLVLAACGNNSLEKIEMKEDDGSTTRFTRDKETYAKEGLYTRLGTDGIVMEEANYVNDTLHGVRKLYYPGGKLQIEETYENGIFQGSFKSYYENGQVQLEGAYLSNSMEGVWTGYYDGGQLKEEVNFKNNNENGPFVEYHQNGKIKTKGTYLDGDNEDGLLELFDENGELVKTMQCVKRICRTSWTKEGGESRTEK